MAIGDAPQGNVHLRGAKPVEKRAGLRPLYPDLAKGRLVQDGRAIAAVPDLAPDLAAPEATNVNVLERPGNLEIATKALAEQKPFKARHNLWRCPKCKAKNAERVFSTAQVITSKKS